MQRIGEGGRRNRRRSRWWKWKWELNLVNVISFNQKRLDIDAKLLPGSLSPPPFAFSLPILIRILFLILIQKERKTHTLPWLFDCWPTIGSEKKETRKEGRKTPRWNSCNLPAFLSPPSSLLPPLKTWMKKRHRISKEKKRVQNFFLCLMCSLMATVNNLTVMLLWLFVFFFKLTFSLLFFLFSFFKMSWVGILRN